MALLIDAALGPRPWGPPAAIRHVLDSLRSRLDRPNRSEGQRLARGALVLLLGSAVAVVLGMAIVAASRNVPLAWLLELMVLVLLAGQRSAFAIGRRAVKALEHGHGRGETGRLAETAADRLALRFADGPVALVLWLALLGLPGVLVQRLTGWLAGGNEAQAGAYARPAALVHRLMLAPAALLTALLALVMAIGLPDARPGRGAVALLRTRQLGGDLVRLPLRAALSTPAPSATGAAGGRRPAESEAALRRLRRTLALFALMAVVLNLACWGAGLALVLNPPRP